MGKEGVKAVLYGVLHYLLRKVTILHLGIYQVYSCTVQWRWISLSLFHYDERCENMATITICYSYDT